MSVKIPSSFGFDLDVDLDGDLDVSIPTDYSISIDKLPTVDLNIRPIEIKPLEIQLTKFPSIRAHLPLNYKVGFSFLGRELACINLCGHGQVITEPYIPYPCEPQPRRPQITDIGKLKPRVEGKSASKTS